MVLATSTNILFERAKGAYISMKDSITACAKAGYRYLDFGFVEWLLQSSSFTSSAWKNGLEECGQLAAALGVQFVQAHATIYDFCNPGTNHGEGLLLAKRCIEGAALLGVPWIVYHPSTEVKNGCVTPETHGKNVAFFQELADCAQNFNVGIAIENMWGTTPSGVARYATQPDELLQLVLDINRGNVGACWDAEHGSIEKIDQGAAIRLLGGHLKALHISDETGQDNIHILPYTGFVQWNDVLGALAEIGYNMPFTFEIQHYLPQMPLELVPAALEFSVCVGEQMIAHIENAKKNIL